MGSRFVKSYVVTIPKNTTSLTRIISGAVFSGILRQINVDIPNGWNYTTGIQIKIGRFTFPQFDAQSAEDVLSGNDTDLKFYPNQELDEAKLDIHGKNLDTVNDHNCVVTIEVEQ